MSQLNHNKLFRWFLRQVSSLVWHYRNADPDFGQWQAVELTDQLENLLANHVVEVTKGKHIVEVKPKHVTKVRYAYEVINSSRSIPKL